MVDYHLFRHKESLTRIDDSLKKGKKKTRNLFSHFHYSQLNTCCDQNYKILALILLAFIITIYFDLKSR